MADYDAIVVGAGHNGLAAACFLARKGLKVLDLEKNERVGGLAGALTFKGCTFNVGAAAMMFWLQEMEDLLEPRKYGWETIDAAPTQGTWLPYPNEKPFILYSDPERAMEHVRTDHGEQALDGLVRLYDFFGAFATGMHTALMNPPVSIGKIVDSMPSVQAQDALRKCFYSSIYDIVYEYFPDPNTANTIRGMLALWGVDGFWGGPMTPGTAFSAGTHLAASLGQTAQLTACKGGMVTFCESLARSFEAKGGQLQLNSPVKRILTEKGKAIGVELETGEKITAKVVLSNLDARASFLGLVGEDNLPADFVSMVRGIHYRNPFVNCFLVLKELPQFAGEFGYLDKDGIVSACCHMPSIEHVEQAWDECKYGRVPKSPPSFFYIPSMFDDSYAPPGTHIMSLFTLYFPVTSPRDTWDQKKEEIIDNAIDDLSKYMPNLRDVITDRLVMCPGDYEKRFGNTNGCFCHGTFEISQMLNFRPVPGWSSYRTPVENFYLCGSACHPGYGVTCLPAYNCTKVVLQDLKR